MKVQSSKFKVQSYYKKIISYFADNLERGQIVLILVLVTVVGLTVGLSLISRTVTDVRISSQIEQSSRAFSAAEAGIESALKTATSDETGFVTLPGASAEYSVANIGDETGYIHNFPFTEPSTTQTFWMRDHDANGMIDPNVTANEHPPNQDLDICWGSDEENKAALLVTLVYYKTPDDEYKIAKAAYDPDAIRRGSNNFDQPTTTGSGLCGGNFKYKVTVSPNDLVPGPASFKSIALRFMPVYSGTAIAVEPSGSQIVVQGKKITSSGQTQTGVIRKIQVTQGYNTLPSLFDFTLSVWNASCP